MFDTSENQIDKDIAQSMELFRRAQVGEVAAVEVRRPGSILLVLDASSQDKTSIALATGLQRRFSAALHVLDARENVTSNELAQNVSQLLGGIALAKLVGESHEQILSAVGQSDYDLVVVPCPFARDLEKLGTDSTGTVIDVLLSRCPVPLLVVRREFPQQEELFDHVLVLVIGENEATPIAAQWATGLVSQHGRLELLLIMGREVYENIRELMRWMDPEVDISAEKLARALQQSQIRLHRALQKTAADMGFKHELVLRRESETRLEELTSEEHHTLLILGLERADRGSRGHVDDRIRHSPHPLFIVPF